MKFTKSHKFLFALLFFLFLKSHAISEIRVHYSSPFFKGRCQLFADGGVGGNDDSLKKVINRDANRASLMSAIVPGLGQAYNRKYWKIPIIYAALGGIGYFMLKDNQLYQNYHNELLYRYNHDQKINTFRDTTTDQLIIIKNQTKKYRDFFIIGMGMVYLLNVIDANVDAHLKKFDVSDNLSLAIRPRAFYCQYAPYKLAAGFTLALNFK